MLRIYTAKARGTAPTLKERIYYQLHESFMKGEVQPDDIINEKALVEHFGVSKSPIREALIELCNEGVLRSIPRYGYRVVRLTDCDVENIRDWRLVLECGFLEKYWHKVTPQGIKRLEQLRMRDICDGEVQSVFEHWQRNSRFHLEMFSFYYNPYATEQLSKALRIATRAYAQFYWDKWHNITLRSTSDYHSKLIEALRTGNRDESVSLLAKDISQFHTHDTSAID